MDINGYYDEFVVDVAVKEEPKDFSFVEDSNVKHAKDILMGLGRVSSELPIKEELNEFSIVDYSNILQKEHKPKLNFITEVIVKKEEDNCDYNFNRIEDSPNKHLRIILTRLKCFMCDHCPVFYETKQELLLHIHTKHTSMFHNSQTNTNCLISCILCSKKHLYKHLHSHMTAVHSVNKFLCKICHKAFKARNYLNRHLLRIHKNHPPAWSLPTNPVKCPLCVKVFTNKHALHTHNKTCHSEQSYTCKVCNSTLKCKTYLNAHMRRVHYDDGKKHICDICTKNFKSPRYLRIHKKNKHYSL